MKQLPSHCVFAALLFSLCLLRSAAPALAQQLQAREGDCTSPNAVEVDGNCYCVNQYSGPDCSIPYSPQCEEECNLGQGDCCGLIGASTVLTVPWSSRLAFYDSVEDTFSRFVENRSFAGLAGLEAVPYNGRPADDVLAVRAAYPGEFRGVSNFESAIEVIDRHGNWVKTLMRFSDLTIEYLNLALKRLRYHASDKRLFVGANGNAIYVTHYEDREWSWPSGREIRLMTWLPAGGGELVMHLNLADIAFHDHDDDTYTIYALFGLVRHRFSDGTYYDEYKYVLLSWESTSLQDEAQLNATLGRIPPVRIVDVMPSIPLDSNGMDVLDDGSLIMTNRYGAPYPVIRFAPDGSLLEAFYDKPEDLDAWAIRKAPNGLIYVADYTGFSHMLVFTQTGALLGDVAASSGYNAGANGLTFLRTAYPPNCQVSAVPFSVQAGMNFTIDITLRDADNEPIIDDVSVVVSWDDMLDEKTITIEHDVTSSCNPIGSKRGLVRCNFALVSSTFAYPNGTDADPDTIEVSDFIITPEFADAVGPIVIHMLTLETLAAWTAAHVRVSVTNFKLQIPGSGAQYLYVQPNTADASCSRMVDSSFRIMPGAAGAAQLLTADAYCNQLFTALEPGRLAISVETQVNGTLVNPTTWKSADGQSQVSLVSVDGGKYAVAGTFTQAGTHLVHVFLDNVEILNSPVSALVVADISTASANETLLSGGGLEIFDTQDWNEFTIEPRDEYQNTIPYSSETAALAPTEAVYGLMTIGSAFEVVLKPRSSEYVAAALWMHNKDGTYTVSYRVVKADDYGQDPTAHELGDWAFPHWVDISVYCRGKLVMASAYDGEQHISSAAAQQSVQKHYDVNESVMAIGLVCGIVGLLCALGYSAAIIYHWEHNIMKFSQKRFVRRVCTGVGLMFVGIIAEYVEVSTATCGINRWAQHVGFVLMVGALTVKTWRVKVIAQNDMKKLKVSDQKLLITLRVLLVCTMLYLAVWTFVMPPGVDHVVTHEDHRSEGTTVKFVADVCKDDNNVFEAVLFLLERALLLYAGMIAYHTRNVHEVFAEAKWIGLSVYTSLVMNLAVVVVHVQFGMTKPDYTYMFTAIGILVSAGGTINFIVLPKLLAIREGKDINLSDFNKPTRRETLVIAPEDIYADDGRKSMSKSVDVRDQPIMEDAAAEEESDVYHLLDTPPSDSPFAM